MRPETRTTCSQCGEATTVPFKPTQGRPVLCRVCFKQQKTAVQPAQQSNTGAEQDSNPPAESKPDDETLGDLIPEPS